LVENSIDYFFQIGVALLCAVLFMLMIGFELVYDYFKEKGSILENSVSAENILVR
jgi:hypothetical protein